MEIHYSVIDQKPIDENRTQVVVETLLPVVINGYGGGRITITVDNDALLDQIEDHVAKKFVNQIKPQELPTDNLVGDVRKVQKIIDAVEAIRVKKVADEEKEKGKVSQDAQPSGAPSDPTPQTNQDPVSTPVSEPPGGPVVTPVDPTPAPADPAPAPVTPAPADPAPAPVTPAPADPAPVTPTPADPAPVTPTPADPAPVTPAPAGPAPVKNSLGGEEAQPLPKSDPVQAAGTESAPTNLGGLGQPEKA